MLSCHRPSCRSFRIAAPSRPRTGRESGQVVEVALLAALLVFTAPACLVLSLFPLYEEGDVESELALVGSWRNEDDGIALDIAPAEWGSYAVTWRQASTTYRGRLYLTRVAGDLFADVTAPSGEDRGPFLVVAHWWSRVQLDGDRLTVQPLDLDWLSSPTGRQAAPGARLDERGNILLTGGTASLRRWLSRHVRRAGVLDAPVTFTRVPPS